MNKATLGLYIGIPVLVSLTVILFYWLQPTGTIDVAKTIICLVFVLTMMFIFVVSTVLKGGGASYKTAIYRVILPLAGLCVLAILTISNISEESHNFDDYLVFLTIGISSLTLLPFALVPKRLCDEMSTYI